MVDSIARIITDDGLSNTITEIERTNQQPEKFNDAGQDGNLKKMAVIPTISENTVEFTGEVQNLHQTQVSSDCTWVGKQLCKIKN